LFWVFKVNKEVHLLIHLDDLDDYFAVMTKDVYKASMDDLHEPQSLVSIFNHTYNLNLCVYYTLLFRSYYGSGWLLPESNKEHSFDPRRSAWSHKQLPLPAATSLSQLLPPKNSHHPWSLPIQEVIIGDEMAQHRRSAGCLYESPDDTKKMQLEFLSLTSRPL
jgi:hypothetical protein